MHILKQIVILILSITPLNASTGVELGGSSTTNTSHENTLKSPITNGTVLAAISVYETQQNGRQLAEKTRQMELQTKLLELQLESQKQGFSCGGKGRCDQMSSCLEASYYMKNCGLKRLDGDGDGIPCETLCGN